MRNADCGMRIGNRNPNPQSAIRDPQFTDPPMTRWQRGARLLIAVFGVAFAVFVAREFKRRESGPAQERHRRDPGPAAHQSGGVLGQRWQPLVHGPAPPRRGPRRHCPSCPVHRALASSGPRPLGPGRGPRSARRPRRWPAAVPAGPSASDATAAIRRPTGRLCGRRGLRRRMDRPRDVDHCSVVGRCTLGRRARGVVQCAVVASKGGTRCLSLSADTI